MNSSPTKYDERYIQWKRWDGVEFGAVRADAIAAYEAELRRARIDSPVRQVVEVGFGTGSFLSFARSKGWQITGIEANSDLVSTAVANGYSAMEPEGFPSLADGSLDLIAAFDVLEHLTHQQIDDLLGTAFRKLRPGGVLIARFPNGDSPLGLCNQNGDVTHITAIGVEKIRYFARLRELSVHFIGPEAQPILCGHAKHMLHRMVSVPICRTLDAITGPLFFPGFGVSLFSRNLVAILKKM